MKAILAFGDIQSRVMSFRRLFFFALLLSSSFKHTSTFVDIF